MKIIFTEPIRLCEILTLVALFPWYIIPLAENKFLDNHITHDKISQILGCKQNYCRT